MKVLLFEYVDIEDNYYGGAEYDAISNYFLPEDEQLVDLTPTQFEELKIGISKHNSRRAVKIGAVEILDTKNTTKINLDYLLNCGKKALEIEEEKNMKNKERAQKAAATKRKKAIEKAAKELGITPEALEALRRG